jgi:glucosamine 6-phosphate synthetase-like amidotransferase/phosphosugar isomerase protein
MPTERGAHWPIAREGTLKLKEISVHTVPLQLAAYHAAPARGTDVDKPRKLAKPVTVE